MLEIQGKYTSAKIFADTIEDGVINQTLAICNHPIFENAKIRIMPDCHVGKGCTIGFTSTLAFLISFYLVELFPSCLKRIIPTQ